MHLPQIIRTLSLGLLLIATVPVVAQTTTLDSLPTDSQEEISRICLPVQFREGASAYRNCVQAELQVRSNGGTNNMAQLSFDDKYAVQQACAAAGGQSSSAYESCVSNQVSELNSIPAPNFDKVSEDELYVVQQSCFDAQSKQGAASYRQCLNTELQALSSILAADTSQLTMLKKNALQLRCSANASTASQYRECVGVEFESIAGTAPTFLPVSTATQVAPRNVQQPRVSAVNETVAKVAEQKLAEQSITEQPAIEKPVIKQPAIDSTTTMALPRNINPQRAASTAVVAAATVQEPPAAQVIANNESTLRDATGDSAQPINKPVTISEVSSAETRVISRPDLVKTIEEKQRAEAQGIELEKTASEDVATPTSADGTTAFAQPGDLWQKFLDTLASLDSLGWLIIAGVLALPALLLGLFSIIRRVQQPRQPVAHDIPLTEQVGPGIKTRMLRHERDADEMFGERSGNNIDNGISQPQQAVETNNDSYNDSHNDGHDAVTRMATKSERQPQAKTTTPSYAWQSAFGHWLTQQPESEKMESCIEFLIYWVAYGDERYGPELKKRLFTASDLNSHDQIKRWVLKQDVFAFSDVVGWLRSNATQEQLEQSIALTMAMLVTENNITPVQNTLLRFLSDAFNMERDELEKRFEQAFGHAMPDIPRTDKEAWWAKQEPETVQQWNSRAIASRPETQQMMARLGLVPGFDDGQVINAFRRAARRCHPDRFTALGDRERAMAEKSFTKFEEARDKLLGVSV